MTIHHVFANRSNAGDWLSARGIQAVLDVPVQEHLCDGPFVEDTLRALESAAPEDLVIVGGGGLFMDYFTPFLEGLRGLASRISICFWGVGVVDLKQEHSLPDRDLLRDLVDSSVGCWLRDDLTREFVGNATLPEPRLCPSVLTITPRPRRERGILHAANLTTVGTDAYAAMRVATQRFAAATDREFRETNNRFDDEGQGLAHTLRAYEASDLVVSSRLHGCLIALAMGRPTLAVSGDRKLDALMHAIGLDAYLVDQSDVGDLSDRLATLDRQAVPRAFFQRQRAAHEQIAMDVRAIASTPAAERVRIGEPEWAKP